MPGAIGLVLGWSMAALLYRAGPGRPLNRRLALVLVLESTFVGVGGGVMYLATRPEDAFALQIVAAMGLPALIATYLSFLSLLDTPITRWLRPAPVRLAFMAAGIAGSVLLVARPQTIVTGVVRLPTGDHEAVPGAGLLLLALALLLTYLYGLASSLLVLRGAPRGSATRRKAKWFAVAFGVKDLVFLLSFAIFGLATSPELLHAASVGLAATGLLLFILLLGYAILREQILDIDLKLKWTLRRGTIASVFVATFFVVTELAQQLLGDRVGSATVGTLAAGALLFALAPLQRLADRFAQTALPGVEDTDAYREARKREIYRAAVESALHDGEPTDKERRVLATLASELGLTPRDTFDVEQEAKAAGLAGRA